MPREIVLTRAGAQRLEQELEQLRGGRRAEVGDRIRQSLEMGRELAENQEYLDAKEEQARLERKILDLEERLRRARVVEREGKGEAVEIGARVRVRDEEARRSEEYEIVGSGEGDPAAGRISGDSPVGNALLDHRVGETVEVETPRGRRHLKILEVA